MRICRILLVGRAVTDVGSNNDQRRPQRLVTRCDKGVGQRGQIIAPVANILNVPAITAKPLLHIVRIRKRRIPLNTDVIVIVDKNQLAQAQMASQ